MESEARARIEKQSKASETAASTLNPRSDAKFQSNLFFEKNHPESKIKILQKVRKVEKMF